MSGVRLEAVPARRIGPASGLRGLVRDPAGRFSWLKTVALVLAIAPGAWIALRWGTVGLGPRSFNAATHETGTWAVRFLLISLAVTPARSVLDLPRVIMLRRLLGVTAACYAGVHFGMFVFDNGFDLVHVAAEIALRFYLTVGFVALLGLLALAVTSTNRWQKRLGRNWKRLHRLVFPVAVLAVFHHFLQAKADVGNAAFAAGVFVWLVLWRVAPRRWRAWRWPLPLLAVGAGLATAAIEASWYGLATGISGWRVLDANLDLSHGPRPAEWVAMAGFVALGLALVRGIWRQERPARGG